MCFPPTDWFSCKLNWFSYERICSRTRFETEARNSEMAFSTFHVYSTEQSPVMVFHASLFKVQVRSVRPQKNGGNKKSDIGKRFQDIRRNYYEGKPVHYLSPYRYLPPVLQMNTWKMIHLNCRERNEDMIDHRSYTHNLSSCEINPSSLLSLSFPSTPVSASFSFNLIYKVTTFSSIFSSFCALQNGSLLASNLM